MNVDRIVAESTVSGTQAPVPKRIRRDLGIDDGDRLRWHLEEGDSVHVGVVDRRRGTFAGFNGYEGDETTDVTGEHDDFGVD